MRKTLSALSRLRLSLRRFRSRDGGAAAVEFALVVPVMLVLYAGTVEVTAMISLSKNVQKVAGAVGDLVSQSDSTVKQTQVMDYFAAARTIMPGNRHGLRQAVTAVEVSPTGTPKVLWSVQAGGATILPKGADFELPDAITAMAPTGTVIVSESWAVHRPLYGFVLEDPITMGGQSFFMPRFGGKIELR